MKPYVLLLPPLIPALVGKEISVYFDNLIYGESKRYDFEVACSIGRHLNERWTAVPDKAGDYKLEITVYNEDGNLLSSAKSIVRVAEATAGVGRERSALFIGDSTTAAGYYTGELLRLFANDQMSLTLIGTQGTAPNVHEGRGGWKVATHFEDSNSTFLFNGQFDFTRYMQSNGFTGLTDVFIHLGINEVYGAAGEAGVAELIQREMPMIDAIISSIRTYDNTIRLGIMSVIPPSREQDSCGNSYGTLQSRRTYRKKLHLWNCELQRRYGERAEENIHLIPVNVNLDTANNMPIQWEYANSRSAKQVIRQCNDVHPAPEGYYQMADVIYYGIKVMEGN